MSFLQNETFTLTPENKEMSKHKPKVLMLYGSLRENSYSKFATLEAARILEYMGADVRVFDPAGLPVFDNNASAEHAKVQELRELALWSEAQVWCSPEIHGNMSAVFKNQIDWLPLSSGARRPTQGKTLALMQVTGGSQSFNALNNMRVLGRWMRMFTIANQSSIAKAYQEFDSHGVMNPSSFRDRIVDVMEELMRFTFLLRDHDGLLLDRYSERKASQQNIDELNQQLETHILSPR